MLKEIETIMIAGLGLIGGSIGLRLKTQNPSLRIIGFDRDEEVLEKACEKGCIDRGTTDAAAAASEADLIIIAILVAGMKDLVAEIAPCLQPGTIITDVGSTKSDLATELAPLLPNHTYYIGGHPMAGAETRGVENANLHLFENAVYVLTPGEDTPPEALQALTAIIRLLGANISCLDAAEHDLKVAAISHLPHVIASALVNTVGELEKKEQGTLALAAGGFRDITRIADSQAEMWRDIFFANKESILFTLAEFQKELRELEEAIESEEDERILRLLNEARETRGRLPEKIKSVLPENFEVLVTVPDKPGAIGDLAESLGRAEINILDIEIMRVRDEAGGTMKFGFAEKTAAERAVLVFEELGYPCRLK